MKIVRENSLPQINSFSFLGAFKETQQLSQEYQGIRNYKLSKYNKLQKYDSDIVIYNMASDSIVIFDDKEISGKRNCSCRWHRQPFIPDDAYGQ